MEKLVRNSTAEFLIFTSQAGDDSIEVRVEDETVWLTQELMAELFGVDVRTISEHLKNIFQSNKLKGDLVVRKFRITAADDKKYLTQFYNLDAIISVGYRVNSKHLENGVFLGEDYFERLLSEVREIRLSERRFYQKITDIYATSLDYNKND